MIVFLLAVTYFVISAKKRPGREEVVEPDVSDGGTDGDDEPTAKEDPETDEPEATEAKKDAPEAESEAVDMKKDEPESAKKS
jgi:hypothetical protein